MSTPRVNARLLAVPAELCIPDDRAELGRGYKFIDHEFTSNSALDAPRRSEGKASGEWRFRISVVESKQQLIDSLDLKVSAEGSVWGAKVSGAASWAHSAEINRDTLLVVVSARRESRIDKVDFQTARLRDEAGGLMDRQEFSAFYDKYGSHFVSSSVHGSECHIVFRRDFDSLSEKKKATAELSGKGTGWSGKADAAKETTKTIDSYRLRAEGHGVGSMVEMKDFGDMKARDVVNWKDIFVSNSYCILFYFVHF
jgi:hypothetical protein